MQKDRMRIDSHKLIYHPERVAEWHSGKDIYPIFLDVSPTSACNHRCIFCGLDFAHKTVQLKEEALLRMAKDAGRHGVKSIMYAGEGEPLLHKGMPAVIKATKESGIDVALNTNGVLLTGELSAKILKYITWVRVSIDAGTPGTYSMVHSTRKEDFEKVLQNISEAVQIKRKNKLKATIGTQFLLLKENADEASRLAAMLKKIGVDYLIIKPYSKHPLSINDAGTELDYSSMRLLGERLSKMSSPGFNLIFRGKTMEKKSKEKPYKHCLGAPFWAYVSSTGDIYPCHTFLGIPEYSLGNLNKSSFSNIWKSKNKKKVMKFLSEKMDAGKCRELCRLDEINKYLWELTHPHEHVNFI